MVVLILMADYNLLSLIHLNKTAEIIRICTLNERRPGWQVPKNQQLHH